MDKIYTCDLNINGVNVTAKAKLWDFEEQIVDLDISENGEHVWRNFVTIYSLKDAATTIRHRYKSKGIRIKWVEQSIS